MPNIRGPPSWPSGGVRTTLGAFEELDDSVVCRNVGACDVRFGYGLKLASRLDWTEGTRGYGLDMSMLLLGTVDRLMSGYVLPTCEILLSRTLNAMGTRKKDLSRLAEHKRP